MIDLEIFLDTHVSGSMPGDVDDGVDALIAEQKVLFDASIPSEEDSIDGPILEDDLTVRSKGSSQCISLLCISAYHCFAGIQINCNNVS